MIKKIVDSVGYALSGVSPKLASHLWYFYCFRKPLNLRSPKTLNEKLMWLKLNTYRNDPLVTQCADKYRVREYIEQVGCPELLNTLYGAWDSAEQIDWDSLPDAFVLKCNHGCGYNILCAEKSKLDIPGTRQLLDQWMHTDFWRVLAEVQYQNIPKKIICEAFLGDGNPLLDYKIYCFHGKAEYILVCTEREFGTPKFYFFNRAWELCPITRDGKKAGGDFTVERPSRLEEMLEYAERLSAPFPFVRVDFYYVEGRIVFGELTFIPSGALDATRLPETDVMFGEMLELPSTECGARKKT